VDETSAAPIFDKIERCGIAADHRGMCKFENASSQDFRTVVAALRRYSQEALDVIRSRYIKTTEMLAENQRHEAMEILKGVQASPADAFSRETVHRIQDSVQRQGISGHVNDQEKAQEGLEKRMD